MRCLNPINLGDSKNIRLVNCGKCHACRINKTSEWTYRLLGELKYWNYKAAFITLTYDDEHLPPNFSLLPCDLTLFWKKLRKRVSPIRYYACGEYGSKELKYNSGGSKNHGRPHYHAIVYGLDYWNNEHRKAVIECWQFCDPLRFAGSKNGFAEVTIDDIRYVAGYCQKKLDGQMKKEVLGVALAPFSRSSHGLGLEYCYENSERISKNGFVMLGKHKLAIPRYYRNKLGITQVDCMDAEYIPSGTDYEKLWDKFVDYAIANKYLSNKSQLLDVSTYERLHNRFLDYLQDIQFARAEVVNADYMQLNKMRGNL